jgi:hypothetical protein
MLRKFLAEVRHENQLKFDKLIEIEGLINKAAALLYQSYDVISIELKNKLNKLSNLYFYI